MPSRDEMSERVVDPRGVVSSGRFAYLDAWCHSAGAMRFFRLDRIDRADPLDSPVATEPAPPREVTTGLLGGEAPEEGTTATLVLQPEADWVPHYYPVEGRTTARRRHARGRHRRRRPALAAPPAAPSRALGARRVTPGSSPSLSPPARGRRSPSTADRGVGWRKVSTADSRLVKQWLR
ncbi:WYL domain-containing protein [Nocardioides sp. TF02-7]|nr:WYL domain-containing protein [Nocardioides sp. TF02-7]